MIAVGGAFQPAAHPGYSGVADDPPDTKEPWRGADAESGQWKLENAGPRVVGGEREANGESSGERHVAVEVEAQVTGHIWKVERALGDAVQEEDVLLIIESMKMEIPLEAPCDGRVSEIRVEEGQGVEEGDVLVVLEA